ncbi:MAG TPA: hypothetical protein VG937_12655 [Polyangiaceae bacterium]|nr:hypothetical protein [Polyangiaceae bacterium]
MSVSRSPKSLRAAISEQAPLLIALVVIALVIVFTRERKAAPVAEKPASAASAPPPSVPSEPEPIPEEPPLGPLRAENAELPCDVDDVLARKCRRCHAIPPRHGAPFPLFTWTDLQAMRSSQPIYEVVARVVQTGYMPYRIPANPPVEPLTDAEKKTLLDWVAAGAPRESCKPTATKRPRTPAKAKRPN